MRFQLEFNWGYIYPFFKPTYFYILNWEEIKSFIIFSMLEIS